jgi:hypothetical protein
MVAKLALFVLHLCLLLTFAVPHLVAQDSHPTSNRTSGRATKQQEGFLDFALKRINPSDLDYGQCLDEGRKLILEQTLSRGYFWSNVAALGLLGVFLIVIVHHQRLRDRRELIASESLTQYHNALARAEAQVTEATKRNHALMEALTEASEAKVTGEGAESSVPKNTPSAERKRIGNSDENGKAAPLAPAVPAARGEPPRLAVAASSVAKTSKRSTPNDPSPPGQIGLFGQDGDLVAKVNALQQQLSVYKEREKELVRQASFAELRLQKEQQKNRSLKGD